MNFLSSLSAYAKLVDHGHQASDLDTFSSHSLDKQEEVGMYHLRKGMLDELMKKNAKLIDKLSNKRIHHDARMFEMKESMFTLKSSIGQKDDELKSIVTTLLELKEAYFHHEHKYAVLAQNRASC
ncbi:unnamed protein product [Prunus armeniaca]